MPHSPSSGNSPAIASSKSVRVTRPWNRPRSSDHERELRGGALELGERLEHRGARRRWARGAAASSPRSACRRRTAPAHPPCAPRPAWRGASSRPEIRGADWRAGWRAGSSAGSSHATWLAGVMMALTGRSARPSTPPTMRRSAAPNIVLRRRNAGTGAPPSRRSTASATCWRVTIFPAGRFGLRAASWFSVSTSTESPSPRTRSPSARAGRGRRSPAPGRSSAGSSGTAR